MKKHVLLAGGFHKTKALAGSLLERGFAITIINKESHSCSILADQFPSLTIIHGDATKPFILEEANAENIDIAIALTQRDDENLVICELCKKKFHVEKTVSLVNDPKKIDFFYQSGVDSVVCAITTVANIIEHEAIMEEMGTSIPIGAGHIRIVEVPISGGSPAMGKRIWQIGLPEEAIIGCILRDKHSIVPHGDTCLLPGDILILIVSDKQEKAVLKKLIGR